MTGKSSTFDNLEGQYCNCATGTV